MTTPITAGSWTFEYSFVHCQNCFKNETKIAEMIEMKAGKRKKEKGFGDLLSGVTCRFRGQPERER